MKDSITKKMLLGVILASTCITVFVTLFQLYSDYNAQVNQVFAKFDIIFLTSKGGISNAIWDLDEAQVGSQMAGLVNFPSVDYVEIKYHGVSSESELSRGV